MWHLLASSCDDGACCCCRGSDCFTITNEYYDLLHICSFYCMLQFYVPICIHDSLAVHFVVMLLREYIASEIWSLIIS